MCLNEEKETLESDAVNNGKRSCQPAHDDEEQQQQQQQQCSNTLHSSRQVYTNTYTYVVQQRTTVKSIILDKV